MRRTSLDAYKTIQDELGPRQKLVYACLLNGPKTNQEISDFLNIPINQVTPRTNELASRGMVRYAGVKISEKTRKRSIIWAAVNTDSNSQLSFT